MRKAKEQLLRENVRLLSGTLRTATQTLMTLKRTLLLCQIYLGCLRVTSLEFHPVPNGALLRTLVKYRTTSTPLSPSAKIRERFVTEQKVTSSESPRQLPDTRRLPGSASPFTG